jgi:protein TonB
MKSIILIIVVFVLTGSAAAQNSRGAASDTVKVKKEKAVEENSEPVIYTVVEDMPRFPGGDGAMLKFITENIVYPDSARENNIQGRVVVKFVVDEEGKIGQVKVVSKPLGWGLEEEAIRVVTSMPNWIPGKQRGVPVQVYYTIPIRFQLGE